MQMSTQCLHPGRLTCTPVKKDKRLCLFSHCIPIPLHTLWLMTHEQTAHPWCTGLSANVNGAQYSPKSAFHVLRQHCLWVLGAGNPVLQMCRLTFCCGCNPLWDPERTQLLDSQVNVTQAVWTSKEALHLLFTEKKKRKVLELGRHMT